MPRFSIDILRLRNFRFLLFTRISIGMALQCQAVIVGWQIYSITKNTFMLGLTGLAEAIPAICCALFAGHVVDTNHPFRIYRICLTVLLVNTLILLLIAGGFVQSTNYAILISIYIGVFISGLARSFIAPSSFSLLPMVVPRHDLATAIAWSSSGMQTAMIMGPALAGLVYGLFGAHIAWLLPASLVICATVMINFLKAPEKLAQQTSREPIFQSIRAGWSFILKNPVLLSVMSLDMFAVLFGGAVAMLPAYADQVLHVGSQGLGALRAATAVGSVLTTLTLALRPMKKISAKTMLWVVTGFGLCMIGFGLSTVFWLSFLFLALSGVFDGISVIIRQSLAQFLTPDNMRGRISSVSSMFIISSNEIGSFESGTMARLLGLVPSVVFGGIGTLIVVAITAILSPQLRKTVVETGHGAQAEQKKPT